MTARRRRDLARRLKAFDDDLELLVLRPATPSAGLDDLQALNPPTVRMDVHTHCLLSIRHPRKDGRDRRNTAYAASLDEPTRGVNAGANREIYRLINALVDAGSGVLQQCKAGAVWQAASDP